MTGNDRKLQVALEQSIQDQLGSPNHERLSVSPFGPLSDRLSRQTLIYLITTLNCAFPFYDFSYVLVIENHLIFPLSPKLAAQNAKISLSLPNYSTREQDFLGDWNQNLKFSELATSRASQAHFSERIN